MCLFIMDLRNNLFSVLRDLRYVADLDTQAKTNPCLARSLRLGASYRHQGVFAFGNKAQVYTHICQTFTCNAVSAVAAHFKVCVTNWKHLCFVKDKWVPESCPKTGAIFPPCYVV